MKVRFEGFKFCAGGPVTKELGNGEMLGPTLRQFGINTEGIQVIVGNTTVGENDLNSYPLRDGDVIKATVKAIGGTDEPKTADPAPDATASEPEATE